MSEKYLLPPMPPYLESHECKAEMLSMDVHHDLPPLPTSQSDEALVQSVLAASTASYSQNLLPPSTFESMLPPTMTSHDVSHLGLDLTSVGVPPSSRATASTRHPSSADPTAKRAKSLSPTAVVDEAFAAPLLVPPPPPETFRKTVVKRSGPLKTAQDKKKAHNAVERRYRNSINDRINELKDMLPATWTSGPKVRTNKAAILHKVIEYVSFLVTQTARLQHENTRLQELLKLHGIDDAAQFIADDTIIMHLEHLSETLLFNNNVNNATEPKQHPAHLFDSSMSGALPAFDPTIATSSAMHGSTSPSLSAASFSDHEKAGSDGGAHSPHSVTSSVEGSGTRDLLPVEPAPTFQAGFGSSAPASSTRLMMVTTAIVFGMASSSWLSGSVDANAAAAPSHGHARVLSSVELEEAVDLWQLAWVWICQHAVWWLLRLGSLLLFGLAISVRDPIQSVETAQVKAATEAERKTNIKRQLGDQLSAVRYAKQSLAYLGHTTPSLGWDLYFATTYQSVRQGLHRVAVGVWMDRKLASAHPHHDVTLDTTARTYHHLHQLTLSEASLSPSERLRLCYYYAVQAINACETAPEVEAALQVRLYAAMAGQLVLTQGNSILANQYLGLARQALLRAQRDTLSQADEEGHGHALDWLSDATGRLYFLQGAWKTDTSSATLAAISRSYRHHLLHLALHDLVRGRDLSVATTRLHAMLAQARQDSDLHDELWALSALAANAWRSGEPNEARRCLVALEGLGVAKTVAQDTVYSALRAHQALLDGDHALCWKALDRVSTLFSSLPSSTSKLAPELYKLVKFWILRHLMGIRVSLYRLRSYLASARDEPLAVMASPEGRPVAFADMLTGLQHDLDLLSVFAEECRFAQPQLLMLRAVCRSLALGRTGPTEQLFNQSCRAARELNQPYDLGLALLHMSACLRGALPRATLKQQLETAAESFLHLDAGDELSSCRKLLKVLS